MLRNIAFAAAVVGALCMPLAASAKPHGGHGGRGGHHSAVHRGSHGSMHHGNMHRGGDRGGMHRGAMHDRGGRGRHVGRGHGHHHSHARRFWHGRWFVYGVGPCWRWSNYYDEFVWVCR
jgi:hypothetical protein